MNATSTLHDPLTCIGVGIDTARYGHHVSFLREDKQQAADSLAITESREGYEQLSERLQQLRHKHPQATFHVHIDAAGQYASNLERFLRSLPLPTIISIGEPKRNKDYHKAVCPKRTSDATESQAMARFGVVEKPDPTPSVPEEFYVLREIASRLQGQVKDTTRAINRLHNLLARVFPEFATLVDDLSATSILALLHKYPTPQRIAAARLDSLNRIPYLRPAKAHALHEAAQHTVGTLQGDMAESLVQQFTEQVQECLRAQEKLERLLLRAYHALPGSGHVQVATILGIGEVTAAVLVSKIISLDRFATPEHLVGYFGVFPEENTSGFNRQGEPLPKGTMQMSAKGSDIVRRYLWNAAKSALQCNPAVRSLYTRLRARGKRGDVAMGHCMRKLLHLVFAVWSTNTPFSKTHYAWQPADAGHTEPPAKTSETVTTQQRSQAMEITTAAEAAPVPSTPETGPLETRDEADRDPEKMAAGHTREPSPQNTVVTATTSSEKTPTAAVNQRGTKRGTIDFAFLREQVSLRQALQHLGLLDRLRETRGELRGPCPIHGSQNPSSRSFAVNLAKNVFSCHNTACAKAGNVIDFWAAVHKLPLYEAACHLADTFHVPTTRTEQKRRGARNMK